MSPPVFMAASVLLCYPDDRLYGLREAIKDAVPALRPFVDHVDATPRPELEAHYVETFDLRSRCSLYLTYYTDGDTRRRGASLVAIKQRYRSAGFDLSTAELPDFLPVMLEFSAVSDPELLQAHRAGLELLRLSLTDRRTPYATVVTAVCETLPGPSPRDRAEAMRLARSGPPSEAVGVYS